MRRRTPALALAALSLLAACGTPEHTDANRDVAKPIDLPSVNATVRPTEAASASPSGPAAGGTSQPAEPAAKDTVTLSSTANTFSPAELKVAVGATVTWKNDGGFHSVTGGKDSTADPASPIKQEVAAFEEYKLTFDKAGTYDYFCQPHASLGMVGKVVVG
jgi:plastocyanin